MDVAISVVGLKKNYQVENRKPGLKGFFSSFFNPQKQEIKAVDNLNFKVKKGELIGFIGPNGAGKTTTLKCLSGLLYPTSGQVLVAGFCPWERKKEFLQKMSFVMGQKNQLWWDLPALETFKLNQKIYNLSDSKYKKNLKLLSETLQVENDLHIPVRKLSLGQRMKCELIAALLHEPEVLFLDEPTIGLDIVVQEKIRSFIREYNRRSKATIILTSHYMEDVQRLAERIIIIDKGKIVFDGKLQEIIDKFADHKFVTLNFSRKVEAQNLKIYGRIKSSSALKAVIAIKRDKVSHYAAEILKKYPVVDLNIIEPPIQDIIRELFTGKDYS